MIRSEHVDETRSQRQPQLALVVGAAHGRVHLGSGAETAVGFRCREGEMVRRHLARSQILVGGEQRQLIGGRNMQGRECACRPDARDRGGARSPAWPSRRRAIRDGFRVARHPLIRPGTKPRFILGMKGRAAGDRGQDAGHAGILLDQQTTRRGSHEDLDAATSRQALEITELARIVDRAADKKAKSQNIAAMPA